jgi:4-oxalomesaconate tautomerase
MTTPVASRAVPCMLMRGGTSKGAYFLASDLPGEPDERDDLLLRIMGSPDGRQIDGIGGAHPLTSKVAVVSPSGDPGADVDYLFLQVHVDEARVADTQNCGNILAGIAPFALERGLLAVTGDHTEVRVRMVNTGGVAVATVPTPNGQVIYDGDTAIAGVPGTAAPVLLRFLGIEGSTCGALLPTGAVRDELAGIEVTCVDNGMPVVLAAASSLGIGGYETPAQLEADATLRATLERVRLAAGPAMNLGDVTRAIVPKMTIVAPPRAGGTISTRTFIPHRCHLSIGVFGAVAVASAVAMAGSVAHDLAGPHSDGRVALEHPGGIFEIETTAGGGLAVVSTARRLFDGLTWPGPPRRAGRRGRS